MKAAKHPIEADRLAALRRYELLDTPREAEYDDMVNLLARLCDAPVAVINLIDADRQWFKAETGLGVRSTPLETSLCSHVILENNYVEIPDTAKDARMRDNPLCMGDDGFRFYAGALLKDPDGLPIGTLCVLDTRTRELSPLQRDAITVMAAQVMRLIEFRLALKREDLLRREVDHRVKNSLQTVASIIALQASETNDSRVLATVSALKSRLQGIIAFHEELHQNGNGSHIDLADYLPRLARYQSAICFDGVVVTGSGDHASLMPDTANAIAMIVNEFTSNAMKHVYGNGRSGEISFTGHRSGNDYCLICSDGSEGLSDLSVLNQHGTGIGLQIIAASALTIGAQPTWSNSPSGLTLKLEFVLAS